MSISPEACSTFVRRQKIVHTQKHAKITPNKVCITIMKPVCGFSLLEENPG